MLSINVHGSKEALLDFITNEVAIDINVLSSLVKNGVSCYVESSLAVTK